MRIGIFINTPSQFHFYKNVITELQKGGDEVHVIARNYGETVNLLKELEVPFFPYSSPPASKAGKVLALPMDVLRAYGYLKDKHVDAVTGFGIYNTFTASLLRTRDIIFNDTEPLINNFFYSLQVRIFMLMTDVLITPRSFRQYLGKKQYRINGYKEMAYLHPNHYKPDESIFDLLGIARGRDYAVVRFNAFDALHDVGKGGFDDARKLKLVKELEKHASVFISSEVELPEEIKGNLLKVPRSRIHDVLYFAKLLVTDTSTIATEAALLGTPAVRSNGFVGKNDAGNYIELENRYGLIFNVKDPDEAIKKALELIQMKGLKDEWKARRDRLMKDNIDVSSFMSWFIKNYPDSLSIMRGTPDVQDRFR